MEKDQKHQKQHSDLVVENFDDKMKEAAEYVAKRIDNAVYRQYRYEQLALMTKDEIYDLGYRLERVTPFEVGLLKLKQGKRVGIRSWFAVEFDLKFPTLDHPKVLEAIRVQEEHEEGGWV